MSHSIGENCAQSVCGPGPVLSSPDEPVHDDQPWTGASLVLFRFFFIYFGLYNSDAFIDLILSWNFARALGFLRIKIIYVSFWNAIINFTGRNVFRIPTPIVDVGWAPSDATHGWIRVFCILTLSIAFATVWSIIDRKATAYRRLNEWFRLSLRVALLYPLLGYGIAKVIKTQFPDTSLLILEVPVGELRPMGLLWTFIGFSQVYCVFGGLAEVVPALFLTLRQTTLLGALLSATVMVNIVLLNLCYGVWVKLYSIHLLLISIVLVAPDLYRLLAFLVQDRDVRRRGRTAYFASGWLDRGISWLPAILAIHLLCRLVPFHWHYRQLVTARSPLYGIWQSTQSENNGHPSWRTVIFDSPDIAWIQTAGAGVSQLFSVHSSDRKRLTMGPIKNWDEYYSSRYTGRPFVPEWVTRDVYAVATPEKDRLRLRRVDSSQGEELLFKRKEPARLIRQRFRWVTNPGDYDADSLALANG